ncbi:prostaglandin reductase 1-like isoform X2 [Microplitis mediator]|uniref:prostaglandin reductase 1-like isoform X2 n=1 Tax=Microplitis mediator TaxID=375433 RepID=UPI0025556517|nr:prostaglandin reductase 1-like isoform X2 [Microplitis mediator]
MVTAKKYILVKHFEGEPKPTDVKIEEEELPSIKNGVEAEYLSVDPYMRLYIKQLPLNSTMFGVQIALIIESKNQNYPVGKRIVGHLGWRTHTIINMSGFDENSLLELKPELLSDFGDLPLSLGLSVLGLIGHTAYLGFTEICEPKAGETLVVSGAAGAVGSHVGQIGKILGMKVIGIAGSDAKCQWIIDDLGFDHAINYKTQDVAAQLKKVTPQGIDCYFDNVGGEISSAVIYQMNPYGRVSVCGSISAYNDSPDALPKCTVIQPAMVTQQLKIEGFLMLRWKNRSMEAFEKNLQWIRQGKLVYRETVTEGFENMFSAFLDMLRGGNFGKAVVKV